VSIRDQSADQRKGEHCQETDSADDTHGDGIPAQLTDMPEQGPLLHLAAYHRDDQAKPDQGELSVLESRRQVDHGGLISAARTYNETSG
jgi:hypothetical protein